MKKQKELILGRNIPKNIYYASKAKNYMLEFVSGIHLEAYLFTF